jgi:TolB protein
MKKSHHRKLLEKLPFVMFFLLLSCQSSRIENSVDASNLSLPSGYKPPVVQKLTGAGVNSQGALSPDGRFLAFISSSRPNHDNPQVYVRTLQGGQERRLTFQDGQTAGVVFSPDSGRVIYASTTDEQKEDTNFIKASLERISGKSSGEAKVPTFWQEQPFELYTSLLSGSRIERLTQSPLYDSEPSVDPADKKIVFISARDRGMNLHLLSTTGTYLQRLTTTSSVKARPQFSKDGRMLAWIEYGPDLTTSDLFVADSNLRKVQKITDGKALHLHPTWMADHKTLIFSSNRDHASNFELYSIQLDGTCLQRLSWHSANETEPDASHSGRTYIFTSDRSGEKQVYQTEYVAPATCSSPNS